MSVVVLLLLASASFSQIRFWQNSIALFRHDLDVSSANITALNNLGVAFFDEGRTSDAEKMYRLALTLRSDAPGVHKNLGLLLARKGDDTGAISEFTEGVRLDPRDATLQNFLGQALVRLGKNEEALPHFVEAARLAPDIADCQNALAVCLATLGRRAEALEHYHQAVLLEPGNAHYQNNFATALLRAGEAAAATEHYRAAIAADPNLPEPYSNLGALYFMRRLYIQAADLYTQAIRLNPTNAGIRFNAARVMLKLQNNDGAIAQFAEAARLRPDWAEPLDLEAWTLATSPDDKVRNGAEAVKLAEKAAELTARQQPGVLLTLAAAYAETGRFNDALSAANQGLEIARQLKQTAQTEKIQHAITLFQAHTPLRENGVGNQTEQ